jgi:hypothetical protein
VLIAVMTATRLKVDGERFLLRWRQHGIYLALDVCL